jgi:HNH endonuclease
MGHRKLYSMTSRQEANASRRKIRPDAEPFVAAEYLRGISLSALAEKHDCSSLVVRKSLLRQGVQLRRRGAVSPYRTDPAFSARVQQLWLEGNSITSIAANLDVNEKPVARALNDAGIYTRNVRGERHGRWTGGRWVDDQGYAHIRLQPEDRYASMRTVNGYVFEHRLVMAEYLGRPLWPHETVHHIDGVRTHNTIDNLQLRIGKHGNHLCYQCADCGSMRLQPIPIAETG